MEPFTTRALVRRARRHLDEWLYEARSQAFAELFEGSDARLSDGELALLDRIDSALSRQGRDGLWGTDQYGVLAVGPLGEETAPRVVCVYHPEIPEDFAIDGLDDATAERMNQVLWDYGERVARAAQPKLDAFVEQERGVRRG